MELFRVMARTCLEYRENRIVLKAVLGAFPKLFSLPENMKAFKRTIVYSPAVPSAGPLVERPMLHFSFLDLTTFDDLVTLNMKWA